MAKVTDLQAYRKQREKQRKAEERKKGVRRFFTSLAGRLLILAVILGAAFWFFNYADRAEIQGYISENITGSGREQGFPIMLSSKNGRTMETISGGPLVLTETNLQAYNGTGHLLRDVQHGYKAPTLKVKGKYYLLYDRGSVGFQSGTRNSTSYERKSAETILTGAVSSGGKVGIASAREGFGSSFTVYSRGGDVIFGWYTTEGYITCLDLDESRGLVGTISTDLQGAYQSTVYYFNFRVSEHIFKLDMPGEIVYSCTLSGNSLEVVTAQNYYRFSNDGRVEEQFPYGGMKLVSFAMGESCTALVLADSLGDYRQELCVFRSPETPTRSAYEVRQVSKLKVNGDRVLLIEGGMMLAMDGNNGELLSSIPADDSDRDMAVYGNNLYVLSSSSVTEHDLGEKVEESYTEKKPPKRKNGNFWDDAVDFFRTLFFIENQPEEPAPTPQENLPAENEPAVNAPPEEDTAGKGDEPPPEPEEEPID